VVKEHALAAVQALRTGEVSENDFLARLAADGRLGLDRAALDGILAEGGDNVGAARKQVEIFSSQVQSVAEQLPAAVGYEPGAIL